MAAITFGISLPLDPLRTNLGLYLYGSQAGVMDIINCKYFAEGPTSSVAVITYGENVSCVNGKVDAGDLSDMSTQLGLAYFPHFLSRSARRAGRRLRQWNDVGNQLVVPGHASDQLRNRARGRRRRVISARQSSSAGKDAHDLERENESLPQERRRSPEQLDAESSLRMVYGDGHSQLQGDEQSYDIIVSEPSNPWLAGVSNLFTEEFFTTAPSRLRPGGVLAQWVQTYNISLSDYLMIVRTMRGGVSVLRVGNADRWFGYRAIGFGSTAYS